MQNFHANRPGELHAKYNSRTDLVVDIGFISYLANFAHFWFQESKNKKTIGKLEITIMSFS